jgi:hypothetical protein
MTALARHLRWWLLLACLAPALPAAEPLPRQQLDLLLANGAAYLRTRQAEDGSFGTVQPHLQTALATLALHSLPPIPDSGDPARIARAADYLVKSASLAGDLGDDEYATESHAVALAALLAALPTLTDPDQRQATAEAAYKALRYLQRMQDRSSSAASRGGWKLEGQKGRDNDRRATAWALFACHTAQLYGVDVGQANLDRACAFMLGAQKTADEQADQLGGFSVDTEGLAVASISAMGGWVLARLRPEAAARRLNLAWLARNPPQWSGPNYFYTNYFRVRALKFGEPDGELYQRQLRQLILQLKEHQQPSGAVEFPPGNAQNTVAMGPVFSTAMALLIANVHDSRLAMDEDWRVAPLVAAPPTAP